MSWPWTTAATATATGFRTATTGPNVWPVEDVGDEFIRQTWNAITAPTLLLYGKDSWASSPLGDGRLEHFRNAQVIEFEHAGHRLHHDQFDRFMTVLRDFF